MGRQEKQLTHQLFSEAAINSLTATLDTHMSAGTQAKDAQEAARDTLKENVWKHKGPFDNSALAYCFSRLNTKDRLLDAISQVALASTADSPGHLPDHAWRVLAGPLNRLCWTSGLTDAEMGAGLAGRSAGCCR
ncbi:hypothetical protein D9M68_742500 [compost metagenome]